MKYTAEIEKALIAQITTEPNREVILPDWAYGKGSDQPVAYLKGRQVRLSRLLYEKIIGPLPEDVGLKMPPSLNPRNVNPHLFVVTASPHTRLACPNGHEYTAADWTPTGHRCTTCRTANNNGEPSVADINSAKTHCPQGHPLSKGNLIRLKSGRRRCRNCHRETQARYRARKGTA